uniref:Uncharacterized protein n=1 Tax=Rhizophora mucronata TaxID=61149 RepID=A0A2P2L5X7_RHIMU
MLQKIPGSSKLECRKIRENVGGDASMEINL